MASTKTRKSASAKARPKAKAKTSRSTGSKRAASGRNDNEGIRIRMYRVGFGDFFLVSVPTKSGPQHILIDCGVHAGNIGSMADCVADLVAVTKRNLALVIVTHFHADHLSGFATQAAEFAQFEVGAVWITNRLDPDDKQSMAFMGGVKELATHLRMQLTLRLNLALDEDDKLTTQQALAKAENALGVTLGAAGGGSNDKAMALVTSGFKNEPPVYYYEAGDEPELPASLQGVLTAQILGPSPKSSDGEFSASDNKLAQYLAASTETGFADASPFMPFEKHWPALADNYPPEAFRPWKTPAELERALQAVQPDALAAGADAVDGTLNNQSLVVLFTWKGKKLLFVGDAQWGNWSYWLYGRGVKGEDPGISDTARRILGSIDFYKVGHHGSTNATPIPAVEAMPAKCVAMCSTETGYPSKKRTYGSIAKKTEVPRKALMDALEEQTHNQAVRSDWIAVGDAKASPEAHKQLEKLPKNFSTGEIYIDYMLTP
jgi:beta-lactamase superfamily II metal-dependent hydrolase